MRLRSRLSRPIAPSISPVERGRQAPAQGVIGAVEVAGGEGGGQLVVGELRLGDHHDAGGVLVQPVHDARPRSAPMPVKPGPQWASSALTRVPSRLPGRRMHDEAGRLVEDDQVLRPHTGWSTGSACGCGVAGMGGGTSSV